MTLLHPIQSSLLYIRVTYSFYPPPPLKKVWGRPCTYQYFLGLSIWMAVSSKKTSKIKRPTLNVFNVQEAFLNVQYAFLNVQDAFLNVQDCGRLRFLKRPRIELK